MSEAPSLDYDYMTDREKERIYELEVCAICKALVEPPDEFFTYTHCSEEPVGHGGTIIIQALDRRWVSDTFILFSESLKKLAEA